MYISTYKYIYAHNAYNEYIYSIGKVIDNLLLLRCSIR